MTAEAGQPLTFDITSNDKDIDPATIDLDPETPGVQKRLRVPGQGTFVVDEEGNVTFTPADGFEGEVSIPYSAKDRDGNTLEPANISIVYPTVPQLEDDELTAEPGQPLTFDITSNDKDIDPATIDLDPETPGVQKRLRVPGQGTFVVDEDGNVTFTPVDGFEGEVSIPYSAKDKNGNVLEPANISIVYPTVPQLEDDELTAEAGQPLTFDITSNDKDIDPATIDLDPETPGVQKRLRVPGQGTFVVDENGNVTFTPVDGFEGEISIPYSAKDKNGNVLEPANISIVYPTVPQLEDDELTAEPGQPLTFDITENDKDIDPTTVDLDPETPGVQKRLRVPGQGTFVVDEDGNVTFTPVDGFEGEVSIPYSAKDRDGNT